MVVEQHAGIARAIYDALSERAFERAAEHVTDRVLLLNVATGDVYRGKTGFLQFARGWAAAFPDLRFQVRKISEAEDRVVVEYELGGRHTGPLVTPRGHIPPTGMEIQVRFCDVLEIVDGEVAHIRSYFDTVTLLRQLGLMSETPLHAPNRRAPLELYAQAVDGNAPQRHKGIVQRFLQDVFNRHKPSAAPDTCAPEFVWHGGALGDAVGLAAYQAVLGSLFVAFPDLEVAVLDTVAEGDRVVVRFSMSGTHLGDFRGIAPTYRRVAGGATSTYRIEQSRIVEEWWQGDVLTLLQQMDLAPTSVHPST